MYRVLGGLLRDILGLQVQGSDVTGSQQMVGVALIRGGDLKALSRQSTYRGFFVHGTEHLEKHLFVWPGL